jgi:uncharacterized protein DUF4199
LRIHRRKKDQKMLRIALIYGAISGAITIAVMTLGYALATSENATGSQVIGYSIMIIALTMIFIGVKNYRDNDLGGVIKFGPAFLLGLAIAGVAGGFYVAGWEIYLAVTDYTFINNYTAGIIQAKRADGVSGEALNKIIADMEVMKLQYANPFYRIPMTFIEIFPVGLVVALVSAGLLRNPKVLPARG